MAERGVNVATLSWNGLKEIAWKELNQAQYLVYHEGQPLGTKAADVPSDSAAVNYDQCFVRDFVPVALVYLIKNQHIIGQNGELVPSR
jgi:Alkaline and neutral invertase